MPRTTQAKTKRRTSGKNHSAKKKERSGPDVATEVDVDRLRTIIKYGDVNKTVDREIKKRRNPRDPVEFLCLCVARKPSDGQFVGLDSAHAWVDEYRNGEIQAAHNAFQAGEFFPPPIGILVVTDSPEPEAWRNDVEIREKLALLGAIIIERADRTGDEVKDQALIRETVAAIVSEPAPSEQVASRGTKQPARGATRRAKKSNGRRPAAERVEPKLSDLTAEELSERVQSYFTADPRDLDY
jgi:hypothetical protein